MIGFVLPAGQHGHIRDAPSQQQMQWNGNVNVNEVSSELPWWYQWLFQVPSFYSVFQLFQVNMVSLKTTGSNPRIFDINGCFPIPFLVVKMSQNNNPGSSFLQCEWCWRKKTVLGTMKRKQKETIKLIYTPVILHSNGKSTNWRCISHSRWGFSIAMLNSH